MSNQGRVQDESGDTLEPEILEPTDDKEIEADAASLVLDISASDSPQPVDSTAVVPVTALQQYIAEVRRHPYLSKEEELQLVQEYRTHGSREAAVKLIMLGLTSLTMIFSRCHVDRTARVIMSIGMSKMSTINLH